ncbi:hypothetical protein DEW08_05210 [Azospirillum thermophilum]|uniref:Invasion associated locus B family protein n=1 Tax=Azospirillum thermophilum TaxID=2202148 RepID=A0A2S2CMI8_9PROT|nr:hypothetical protein DEW08_05210 [Azospirillum thermophilum]
MARQWRSARRFGLLLAGLTGLWTAGAAAQGAAPFQDYSETFKDWKLYCQVWPATRRVECELTARGANDRSARLVWLRSTERWLEGLRFRVEPGALDIDRPVRVWVDNGLFRPEFPCRRFALETNTCAVQDPELNRRLVEKLSGGDQVSAVGQTPAGAKSEIRFSLKGFKAAVERSEQIRASVGTPWM